MSIEKSVRSIFEDLGFTADEADDWENRFVLRLQTLLLH